MYHLSKSQSSFKLPLKVRLESYFLSQLYQKHWTLLTFCLLPLAWVYGFLAWAVRAYHRKSAKKAALPTLVIGNLTLGGAGKTPTALAIADYFHQQGLSVGIILRGYQRNPQAKHTVFSDEVRLLQNRSVAQVVVNPMRTVGIKKLAAAGVKLALCDDGLQHHQLLAQGRLLILDDQHGIGNASCLPAGPLREPLWMLEKPSAVLFNRRSHQPPQGKLDKLLTHLKSLGVPQFDIGFFPMRAETLGENSQKLSLDQLRERTQCRKITAMAGIAHPEVFFQTLKDVGITPDFTYALPDHAPIKASLEAALRHSDQGLVILTDKDAWRLSEQNRRALPHDRVLILIGEMKLPIECQNFLNNWAKEQGLLG